MLTVFQFKLRKNRINFLLFLMFFLSHCDNKKKTSFSANSAASFLLKKDESSCKGLSIELKKVCEKNIIGTYKQRNKVNRNKELNIINALQHADPNDFKDKYSLNDNLKKLVHDTKKNLDLTSENLESNICKEINSCLNKTTNFKKIVEILKNCNIRIKIFELEISKRNNKFDLNTLSCQQEYLLFQMNTSAAMSLLAKGLGSLESSSSQVSTISATVEASNCSNPIQEFKASTDPLTRAEARYFCGDQYTLYQHTRKKIEEEVLPSKYRKENMWYWIHSFEGSEWFAKGPSNFFKTTSTLSLQNAVIEAQNNELNSAYQSGKFHALCECKK